VQGFVKDCRKNPEDIAALIEKLVESKSPAFRNIPDLESNFLLFCRKFLPFKLYSWLIYRAIFSGLKSEA